MCKVFSSRDWFYCFAIAIRLIKYVSGNICPALHFTRASEIVCSIWHMRIKHIENSSSHIISKRETPKLIINHSYFVKIIFRIRNTVRQIHHGLNKVMAISNNPA